MSATGTGLTQLTTSGGTDPAWSADGQRIAFVRSGDIYWMYANGTGVTRVTYNAASDQEPAWNPAGTKIAFWADRGSGNEVYSIDATNAGSESGLQNVSGDAVRSDFAPAWTSGGGTVAYQSFVSGGNNEVYKRSVTGGGAGTGSSTNVSNNSANDGDPNWKPDDSLVAFKSNRDGSFDIWTMTGNGNSVTKRISSSDDEDEPAYSPDGTLLAYVRAVGANDEIYTATEAGGSQTNRTSNAAADASPDWGVADTTAPNTTITAGPANSSRTNDTTPTFEFTSTEAGSTFQCRVNGGSYGSCSSPHTTASLSEGSNTVDVRAIDPQGNTDGSPASRTFIVDTTAPDTTIDSGPAESSTVGDATPTFTFSSSEPSGATFECRYDADTFASCTSPYTPPSTLAQGGHTFEVRSTDAAGNTDASAAIRSFFVQTATVGFSGSAILYNSPGDEENDLTITYVDDPGGDYYEITEGNGSIELNAGIDCTLHSQNVIRCPGDTEAAAVYVSLGPGDDTLDASGVTGAGSDPLTVTGNAGADALTGGAGADYLEGAEGSDTLSGLGGADILVGGNDAGMDRMSGGPGDDQLDGGPGIDRALYMDSTGPVTVTMDNFANDDDGLGGSDNVLDTVESITGSEYSDSLTGSCEPNTLSGRGGDDTLNGDRAGCLVGGGDFMGGGAGNDEMIGLLGTDQVTYTANTAGQPIDVTLNGLADDDDGQGGTDDIADDIEYVYGGAGDDTIDASAATQGVSLWGRAGDDTLIGSGFNDFLRGELGADTLDCGGDTNDMYVFDPADLSVTNCETAG